MMTYEQAEEYLLHIPMFQQKNQFKDTVDFMDYLGNPGDGRKIIHVAGTNGKGSVCAYLRSVLTEAGFRVGMFTSPHLISIRERIRLGREVIGEQAFLQSFLKVKEALAHFRAAENQEYHPAFFEFLFFMAMDFFAEKDTDYIILETGMGGRLDATNVVKQKKLCVITAIGYDHMQYLGDTIPVIAAEKAGIMKAGVPVVFAADNRAAANVIKTFGDSLGCPMMPVKGSDVSGYEKKINEIGNKSIDFYYHTRYYGYVRFSLPTTAYYQIENAHLAIAAVEELQERAITLQHIKAALSKTIWPGRMEEVESGIFLDGAHNIDGMNAFLASAAADDCSGKRYMITGIVRDKQYDKMIRRIAESGLFDLVMVVPIQNGRSVTIGEFQHICSRYGQIHWSYREDAVLAYQEIKKLKQKEDIVYIAGSLYLAGQIKAGLAAKRNQDD